MLVAGISCRKTYGSGRRGESGESMSDTHKKTDLTNSTNFMPGKHSRQTVLRTLLLVPKAANR